MEVVPSDITKCTSDGSAAAPAADPAAAAILGRPGVAYLARHSSFFRLKKEGEKEEEKGGEKE